MLKFLLVLFVLGEIEAQYGTPNRVRSSPCDYPRFEHGRARIRQRSKLIKFLCFPGYELVGNKYATCRDGEWDVPMPVCVKPGCPPVTLENGVQMPSRGGAWVVFFCLPGHRLVGSSALFCNGRRWNGTAPTCVDTTVPSKLSCDFEDPDLCGWTQDELHDFDWKRLNKKTPSSFLFTGPSFDHTFGEQGSGHYMYIESTSRLENDTARLISPIYDGELAKNGCFEFFYHMFGKTTGGLRVFQKPESFGLQGLLRLSDVERQKYTLFEKWGNQGDMWFSAVTPLRDLGDSFQIVIEGIRGKSFTSDIAVDDVSVLRGERCEAAARATTTAAPARDMPDTCSGRCDVFGLPQDNDPAGCACTAQCVGDGSCCPDFFELCVFDSTASADDNAPAELPQTQKLVASTVTTVTTTTSTTVKPTTTTAKSTTLPSTTTKLPTVTTTRRPSPAVIATTAKTTKLPKTTKIVTTTTKLPTLVFKTTTPIYNGTGHIQKDPSQTPEVVTRPTTKSSTTTTKATTKVVTLTTTPVPYKAGTVADRIDRMKHEEEKDIQEKKFVAEKVKSNAPQSSPGSTVLLVLSVLLMSGGVAWLAVWARGARGRQAIARLTGRARHDPEVRYLSADVDD